MKDMVNNLDYKDDFDFAEYEPINRLKIKKQDFEKSKSKQI